MRKILVLAATALVSFSLAACGYSQNEQTTDAMNDGRSLGLNPTSVEVEPGKTETVKVYDWKTKKKVNKKVTSKTEVEITFMLGGCRFEADRNLDAGGDPKVVEGFSYELEDGSTDLGLGVFGALDKQAVTAKVNEMPAGDRPACWKP